MPAFKRFMHDSTPADTVVIRLFDVDGTLAANYGWASVMHKEGPVPGYESPTVTPAEAFAAAREAQERHGFPSIGVYIANAALWNPDWGTLGEGTVSGEPIGQVQNTDLTSAETRRLAESIEQERDA